MLAIGESRNAYERTQEKLQELADRFQQNVVHVFEPTTLGGHRYKQKYIIPNGYEPVFFKYDRGDFWVKIFEPSSQNLSEM